MTRGPLGGPRPFANDDKAVLVLIGVDGRQPPNDVLIATETALEVEVNEAFNLPPNSHTVTLTTNENPTAHQRDTVGRDVIHVQQYEVKTPWREITQRQINAIHNTVVEKINNLGFNVTGTKTTVV